MTETKNYIFDDLVGNLHVSTNVAVVGSSTDDIENMRTVTYNPGKDGKIASGNTNEIVIKGKNPKNPPIISANIGYEFIGWSATENAAVLDLSKEIITLNTTYYAKYSEKATDKALINTDYSGAYLNGYEDKTFRPNNNMTRAEFAKMLTNVLEISKGYDILSFKDVDSKKWYSDSVELVAGAGIINGYADKTFRPENMITRAEVVTIISRCLDLDLLTSNSNNQLRDINGHWAYNDIMKALDSGIINGYPDKTFRPDEYITRAQLTSVMNNILRRNPINNIALNKFIDVDQSYWAFGEILAATNNK